MRLARAPSSVFSQVRGGRPRAIRAAARQGASSSSSTRTSARTACLRKSLFSSQGSLLALSLRSCQRRILLLAPRLFYCLLLENHSRSAAQRHSARELPSPYHQRAGLQGRAGLFHGRAAPDCASVQRCECRGRGPCPEKPRGLVGGLLADSLASRRHVLPDDWIGGDGAVAAIGEQILAPTDVSLSNWTVRPSSGCSVVWPRTPRE